MMIKTNKAPQYCFENPATRWVFFRLFCVLLVTSLWFISLVHKLTLRHLSYSYYSTLSPLKP